MLKGLLNKKNSSKIEEVLSPIFGDVIPLSEVPDPVFAQKMIGDGIAIIPKSGKVVSPVNGEVIQVFPTKHAIGIRSKKGLEILIHIGLETVELNGEGFEVLVSSNQHVKTGDTLANVNLEYLKSKNKDIITPIIITNMEKVLNVEPNNKHEITWGDLLLSCNIK
ncbi:PTS system IIA component, Glc family [Bacillus sp. OV166]|uniref:PTS sugar transporter subunit IIA n=1 Tax=Bacillus sp. OV166 TaxID=1882763 RepID=UPI000A2AC876|nr:PTS glucose transporter subunit IIA [Bacillus sp. OV166]SMQ68625.1 PTS system IIA component, Glc family [Bacillus sp. OV166]